MRSRALRLGFVVALALAFTSSSPDARASHYRLPLPGIVSADEAQLLAKAGVDTTLKLLGRVKTPAQRAELAGATGLSPERVAILAAQVDLLRFSGIGPTMVRLLNASGVPHSAALAAESPAALRERMVAVNLGAKIANAIPQERQIAAWVANAKRAPRAVEGL